MQQNYEDTYLRDGVGQINRLIARGEYVLTDGTLPLPRIESLPDEIRRLARYEFHDVYALPNTPPPAPQPPLKLVTISVRSGGKLAIEGKAQTVHLKTVWSEEDSEFSLLRAVNRELAEDLALACVATRLEWDDETDYQAAYPMRLRNDHASVACSSAMWDIENKQLVAATLVSSEQQSLRAIYASLVTNNKKSLSLDTSEGAVYLTGARRGYTSLSGGLQAIGADGYVNSLVHPLAGSPQENGGGWFYVVCRRGESQSDLYERFVERLQLAIPWPVRLEWAGYLYAHGPVKTLDHSGQDFFGCRVSKSAVDWEQIIREGVCNGYLAVI